MYEKAVVDRIEDGQHAVLLVGGAEAERVAPLAALPDGATEGTWLLVRFEDESLTAAELDLVEEAQTRQRIQEKLQKLRRRWRRLN
ncbi:MAG TPA: DUF3006 domain-containing protein [Dehalococcoidia bacterium]|jgi:hypothetical protein|nr:DUF3006 domain-containing protein [Dehalococcoidia bacterium]